MSHDPATDLADSLRRLIDATIRTLADEATIIAARHQIDSLAARLATDSIPGSFGVQQNNGTVRVSGNVVVGDRNAIAPPLTLHHRPDGSVWTVFDLGAGYEGPPGHVHGGVCAMILDHVLGAAVHQPNRPAVTGTLTVRYRRPTPLGRLLRAEARIRDAEGNKTFVAGAISNGNDVTVEAEGVFIFPRS